MRSPVQEQNYLRMGAHYDREADQADADARQVLDMANEAPGTDQPKWLRKRAQRLFGAAKRFRACAKRWRKNARQFRNPNYRKEHVTWEK